MSATIHHGDCLDVLRGMPDNSVDAICCDPPYGLSNTSPDKVTETIVRWAQGDRGYVPQGRGFMGASWDAFVPPVAVWDECLRVLKPGGHLVAFAGSRTQDLMGLAIRLAGFDLRDSIAWINGAGFPKSLDISKAIEKSKTLGDSKIIVKGCAWIADRCDELGLTRKDLDSAAGTSDMGGWWASRLPHRAQLPTAEQWMNLKPILGDAPDWLDKYILPANAHGEAWGNREVIGRRTNGSGNGCVVGLGTTGNLAKEYDETANATAEAERWKGWGTSLKPAVEPVIVARKPLSEKTVAANTLTWGTGGLNIDKTRIGTDRSAHDPREAGEHQVHASHSLREDSGGADDSGGRAEPVGVHRRAEAGVIGRWPANVVLDTDAATVLDQQSGEASYNPGKTFGASSGGTIYGNGAGIPKGAPVYGYGDRGGASRFFKVVEPDPPFMYAAKAPKRERPSYTTEDGQTVQHATVKPLSIMQWLVKLVTPEGGTVLDPFAGSGTTVEAALLEGFHVIGIEREAEYLPLIQQRIDRATPVPPEPVDDLLGLLEGAA